MAAARNHEILKRYRLIPSFLIFDSSVCLGIPSLVAAPVGPEISPAASRSAFSIISLSRSTRFATKRNTRRGKALKNLLWQWSPLPHYANYVKRQKPLDKSGWICNVVAKDSDLGALRESRPIPPVMTAVLSSSFLVIVFLRYC